MADYRPGQRVALTCTHDLDNMPHVGQQGTVLAHEPATRTVTVGWDDGTVTAVRSAGGDDLDALTSSAPISEDMWQHLLATVTARGADGHQAADTWSRDQTSRNPEQIRGTARQILQTLEDDEELDDNLAPQYGGSSVGQPPTGRQLSLLPAVDGIAWRPEQRTRCGKRGGRTATHPRPRYANVPPSGPTHPHLASRRPRPGRAAPRSGARRRGRRVLRRLDADLSGRRPRLSADGIRRHPDRPVERVGGVLLHPAGRRCHRRRAASTSAASWWPTNASCTTTRRRSSGPAPMPPTGMW
ncbi:hypothetical protein Aau02nite_92200 [Amorphoplanes auranticolor]|uniref:DUF4314 domain-containing protein n=1 Tax=Actinoplanes auranticolor TaxID=47988 RepID=A0A919SXY7_9ACTN|nr:hypothetical protein Aau02nite_92200 [Actinoplanes auranticolor]